MRHNSSLALLDIPDLPIDAFRHVGDRKIKPQGAVNFVTDTVKSVADIGIQTIKPVVKAVDDVAVGIDKFVNDEIPGGWVTVAAVAGGTALASGALTGAAGAAGATEAGVIGAGPVVTGYAGTTPVTMANAGGLLSGTAGAVGNAGLLTGATALAGGGASPAAAAALSSQVATSGLIPSVVQSVADFTGLSPTIVGQLGVAGVQSLISGYSASQIADQQKQAAQTAADAQVRAAQIAADAAKFRPVGVTTRFGQSNFQTDAQGNVIGAGYAASPEIQGYQNRLSALANTGLTQAEQAQAAYAPLQAGAQSLFGLGQNYLGSNLGQPLTDMSKTYMASQAGQPLTSMGQTYMNSQVGQPLTNLGLGYLKQTPEEVAADYIAKQQALLAPTQENQLALLQNKLQQQGRGGLSVAQGGNLGATTPEMQAYYNALAQSNLQLSANANLAGQQQAQFGAGLYGQGVGLTQAQQLAGAGLYGQGTALTQAQQLAGANLYGQGVNLTQQGQQFGGGLMSQGANLQNAYYTGQTGAYAPFATAMDTTTGLENLAQQPMTLGTQIGAKTTASTAQAGNLLSQGITGAAQTMYPSNAFSPSGNVLSGLSQSPVVTGALNNLFGVQPQQQTFTTQQVMNLLGGRGFTA